MRVNRIFVVMVSQDHWQCGGGWAPIWNAQGGVRVVALDRDRCMVPVEYQAMDRLLMSPLGPPEDWDQVPPKEEAAQDERGRSRIEAAPS